MTQKCNEGALRQFLNFHREIDSIITGNFCPNMARSVGNSLQTAEENGRVFLKRYLASTDKGDKQTIEDVRE